MQKSLTGFPSAFYFKKIYRIQQKHKTVCTTVANMLVGRASQEQVLSHSSKQSGVRSSSHSITKAPHVYWKPKSNKNSSIILKEIEETTIYPCYPPHHFRDSGGKKPTTISHQTTASWVCFFYWTGSLNKILCTISHTRWQR